MDMTRLIQAPPPFRKVQRDVALDPTDDAVLEAWVLADTPLDFTEYCEFEWTDRPADKTPFRPKEQFRAGCLFHEWHSIHTIGHGETERICAACGVVEVLKPVPPPLTE